jgi:hypothetical protein
MERESFLAFVSQVIQDVILLAEKQTGRKLPERVAFQWLGKNHPRITQDIPEYILQRVYMDAEHICPCVDIGVGDLLEDGSLLIVANVAGYAPRAFGRNWTGRSGPFVYVVGAPLMARLEGKATHWTPEAGSFGYITPKVPQDPGSHPTEN